MRRLRPLFLVWTTTVALGCSSSHESDARVDASSSDPLAITTALTLDRSSMNPGETQSGHVTYTNSTSGNLHVNKIVIAMRRPGATHAGGPYDDAQPEPGPLDLA